MRSLASPLCLIPSSANLINAAAPLQIYPNKRLVNQGVRRDIRLFSTRFPFHALHSQRRPENNVNQDTDEMFDDLFDKYGKVVFRRSDQKPPSAEADDDAESLSFAVALAKVANEVKAADIRVLFVKPLVYWTRFFIIVTAFSRPQIDAIGSKIRDLAEKQYRKVASGDTKPNSWTLLDFGDVVVHIFLPQQRAFYNLEEFYGNATPIELPFDTRSSFRG
ncbi:protein Iojap, chloroplastic [Magnolia sinica]|uniref:protein Iojap, chloroplastic n=1 Tax=Magnolia sinica TaxID=86752 RepID=UPI00265A820D|nr:protein Iojap, chloroplastic [Magnolia sinica]